MCLGGGVWVSSRSQQALAAGLVDEIVLHVVPKPIGRAFGCPTLTR
jgi:riboflavin biosynthesis pyrimidine reductase